MISTSEIRISVVVDQDDVDLAVTAAHKAFDLDSRPGRGGRLRRERAMTGGSAASGRGRATAARKPTLALVGATGAVGTVMLDIVSTRDDV